LEGGAHWRGALIRRNTVCDVLRVFDTYSIEECLDVLRGGVLGEHLADGLDEPAALNHQRVVLHKRKKGQTWIWLRQAT
jgi:hypothetical protein